MKLIAPVAALAFGVMLLPVMLSGGDSASAPCAIGSDASIDIILATIRHLESGDDYTARAAKATASGAYQFLDSSWGGYGGYPRAYLAPPAVQDAKATENVVNILHAHNGDIAAIPVVWYIGHLPPTGSIEWDTIPYPTAGNTLTPRQYQQRWMSTYQRFADRQTAASYISAVPTEIAAPACTAGSAVGDPATTVEHSVANSPDAHNDRE